MGGDSLCTAINDGPTVFSPTVDDAVRSRAVRIGQPGEVLALELSTLGRLFRGLLDLAGISFYLRGKAKFMVLDGRDFYESNSPFAIQ